MIACATSQMKIRRARSGEGGVTPSLPGPARFAITLYRIYFTEYTLYCTTILEPGTGYRNEKYISLTSLKTTLDNSAK